MTNRVNVDFSLTLKTVEINANVIFSLNGSCSSHSGEQMWTTTTENSKSRYASDDMTG